MVDFISLFDVIFGGIGVSINNHSIDEKLGKGSATSAKTIPIEAVASTIKDSSSASYCRDEYGRFVASDEDHKKQVLSHLSAYYKVLTLGHPYDIGEYEMSIEEMVGESIWHDFGWSLSNLPDFVEVYKTWIEANGNLIEIIPAKDIPEEPKRSTNGVWHLANITLRIAIGDYLKGKGKGKKSVDDFIFELMSPEYTHKINDLLVHLECKGLSMDVTVFREKLKLIFVER